MKAGQEIEGLGRDRGLVPTASLGIGSARSILRSGRLISAIVASVAFLLVLVPNASAAPPNFWGLHFNGTFTTDADDWEAIDRSGAEIYRLNVSWNHVSTAGNWRQSAAWEQTYDKYFELATKANVSILPVLYGRQTAAAEHQFYLSNEWGEWLEFVWTVVQRYGRGGTFWSAHPGLSYRPVLVWEVWNEPNLALNNPGGNEVLPQKYAEFLVATANTIKQAQNAVRKAGEPTDTGILHGGLLQPWGKSIGEFMEKASKVAGYTSSFFGLSLHPYSLAGTEAEKRVGVMGNLNAARQALDAHVGTGKSIWITELGWQVAYSGSSNEPPVTEAEQASLLRWSFDWLEENASTYKLQLVTWYFYRDINVPHWAYHTGLRREDGSYRPAWYQYQLQTGALVPGPEVRHAFRDAGNGNTVSYWSGPPSGVWQQTQLGGHSVAAGTQPVTLRYNETSHIFFVDASRENRITEWSWSLSGGWQQKFLQSDPVASGSNLSAVMVGSVAHIFFADAATGNTVTALADNSATWQQTRFYGPPVALNSSPTAVVINGQAEIYFADASRGNTITQWSWTSTGWQQLPFFGAPVAASSSPSAVAVDGRARIYFADASRGNTVTQWSWNSSTGWQQLPFYGEPLAAGSSPSALVVNGQPEVYFSDAVKGNTLAAWTIGSNGWQQIFFYGDSIAGNSDPSATFINNTRQIYFADQVTNNSVALLEWGTTLQQIRLFGHPVGIGPVGFFLAGKASEKESEKPRFEAEGYSISPSGPQDPASKVTFEILNSAVSCETAQFSTSLSGPTKEIAVSASYSGCTNNGTATTWKMNSCRYELGLANVGPPYTGPLEVACSKAGDVIEVNVSGSCNIKIPAQTVSNAVDYANVGSGTARSVKVTFDTEKVSYTKEGLCELLAPTGKGPHSDGDLGGSFTLSVVN